MTLRRFLLGRPLATEEDLGQRLPKRIGLAVLASDAISSTAYATEEILRILVPVMGIAALGALLPISGIVVVLLAIVATSYRQTIHAYPNGGGAYVVAYENLHRRWALVAGASLLVDYTLTVAVSASAGVAAVVSAFPQLVEYRVAVGLAIVAVMALMNLRGAKESGMLFAIPTYLYLAALTALLGVGLWRTSTGSLGPLPVDESSLEKLTGGETTGLVGLAGALVLARAFSSGAVALSGTEAIANSVPAFRPPEARNAGRTLVMMAAILGTTFFGISLLAQRLQPTLQEDETVLSTMGAAVFGRGGTLYLALQLTTMAILFMAANTAFAGFPRLSSIIARDGYLPRQLAHRGDRLVFSNGVLLLAASAAVLLVAFGGITTALIPLYAVGVFTGFTISQIGMVKHHLALRESGWRRGLAINGLGAVATGIVLATVVISKFTTGAWIPVVVIPLIVLIFQGIRRHYERVRVALRPGDDWRPPPSRHTVVVLVSRVHRGMLNALAYARSLHPDHLLAVHVAASDEEAEKVRRQWKRSVADSDDVELHIQTDPYRELYRPILRFIDQVDDRWNDDVITVVLPEFVLGHWWEHLLHNQSAVVLKHQLRHRPNTVVVSVPLNLSHPSWD